jgi:RNA polymerase sigma factor for flagellar operon FliA
MPADAPSETRSGESLFLSHLDAIERAIAFVASRYRLSSAEAEEFGSFAKLKLIEGDYAILRKFQGRSSVRTYLSIVVGRLFLDYRVHEWGRWRPSAEARRQGPVAVLFEQLTSRDGHAFDAAHELMRTKHGVDIAREDLDRIAGRLPVRVKRRFETLDALANVPAERVGADEPAAEHEREAAAVRVSAVLRDAMTDLDAQDRLLLAMRFEDGRTVAQIASTLRLDQRSLYTRVNRLLSQLRSRLESAGVDAGAVIDMMERPSVDPSRGESLKTSGPRPSLVKGAQPWR